MAPNKTILTLDALDEQTALELPDRELMCGCGGLVVGVGLGANANISGLNATVGLGANVNTNAGLNATVGLGAGLTTGSSGCGS